MMNRELKEVREIKDENDVYDDQKALLAINNMSYESVSQLAVFSQRQGNVNYFNPQSFENILQGSQQAIVQFNVSTAYTLGQTSFLNLELTVNATSENTPFFAFGVNTPEKINGGGSVLNLITDLLIQSKTGEQLARLQYANHYWSSVLPFSKDREAYNYMMGMMGGAVDVMEPSGTRKEYPLYPVNTPITFSIPLAYLHPIFSTQAPLPASLLSGAKIILNFGDVARGIKLYNSSPNPVATSPSKVSCSNMFLSLDNTTAYDSINMLVNQASQSLSTSGLQFPYYSFDSAINQGTGAGANSFNINLSVAKANSVLIKFVRIPQPGDNLDTYDYFATASFAEMFGESKVNAFDAGCSLQLRIGSELMPTYLLTSIPLVYQQTLNAVIPYSNPSTNDPDTLKVANKHGYCNFSLLDYNKILNDGQTLSINSGSGCSLIGFDLSRSTQLATSGVSTNNSRVLSLQLNTKANLSQYKCYIFTSYLTLANITTDNIVVDR